MAYGLLAELTLVTSPPGITGLASHLYRVRFYRRDYTAAPAIINYGTGEPLTLELLNQNDDRFEALRPQKLTVGLIVQNQIDPRLFYAREPKDIRVEVDQVNRSGDASATIFRGWVLPANLKIPYAAAPYPLTIQATCGLPLLKSRPLLTVAGAYPDTDLTLREIVDGALNQIGTGLPLASVVNLRGNADRVLHLTNPALSTIKQDIDTLARHSLPADAFRADGKAISAAEALDRVAKMLGAKLLQFNGEWVLARVNELPGGAVPLSVPGTPNPTAVYVWRRDRDTGGLVGQTDTYTVGVKNDQLVKPSNISGNALQPTQPSVSVIQQFGPPLTRLRNGSFANPPGSQTGPAAHWAIEGNVPQPIQRLGTGSPADPFRLRINGAGNTRLALNSPNFIGAGQAIDFRNADGSVTGEVRNQPMTLTGQFRVNNVRAALLVVRCVFDPPGPAKGGLFTGPSLANAALLSSTGEWLINPNRGQLNGIEFFAFNVANQVPVSKEGWQDFSVNIPIAPYNIAQLQLYVCQGTQLLAYANGKETANPLSPYPANPWTEYTNLALTIGDTQKRITGLKFTVTNYKVNDDAILDPVREADLTLQAGDLPLTVRPVTAYGLSTRDAAGKPVPSYRFDNPRQATTLSGSGKPLALIAAEERAAQFARPAQLLEGDLLGDLYQGPLSIIHLLDQAGQDGPSTKYDLVGWKWDLRMHRHAIVGLEILRTNTPIGKSQFWQTPDGEIATDIDPALLQDVNAPDTYPEPLPVKKPIQVGQRPTNQQLIDLINNGGLVGGKTPIVPLVLNSESPGKNLSPAYPLGADERADAGSLTIRQNGVLLASFGPTGREVFTIATLNQD